jgi:adenylate cyclase
MPTESDVRLEIAHVLFMDIVGYSKRLINEQRELLNALNQIVRGTDEFRNAEAAGRLIKIPTGDGMALVFYKSPEEPVECALEISRALKIHPNLPLRMGVHSGPVSGVIDVNERANVAGAGINMAQRVMDCGDAGHILLSKHVTEDLEQYGHWQPHLHDLGECEVKHGVRVHITNLFTAELGNPELPQKFTQIGEHDIAAPRQKLAVLPLVNDDSSSEDDYLGDGIAEGIIDILSQSPRLQVIARSTAFRYRQSGIDLREVGHELNVDAIFTGRLRRRENEVSIKAELVDVHNGTQLWGQRLKWDLNKAFNVEESICHEIANKLRVRFSAQQQSHAAKVRTENTEAYHLYLKGRYHWNKRTEAGLRRAVTLLKAALDMDPAFARAWAGLADCYTVLGCWGYDAPHDSYPKAKAAAEKAIALDEYLAEAHASLAVTRKDYEWDWAGAEHEYRRALELNPSYALGRHWYGEYLACVGKHIEAIKQLEQARELDPLSPIVAAVLGRHGYYFARHFDRASEELQKVIRSDPEFWVGHNFLGWVYTLKGQWPKAVEQFTIAQQLDQNAETLVGLAYVLGLSGNVSKARDTLAELKKLRQKHYVQPVNIALAHTALGEKDDAFAWLDKACEEHAQWLSEIKVDPAFDPLRSDVRFEDLLKRVGLAMPCRE